MKKTNSIYLNVAGVILIFIIWYIVALFTNNDTSYFPMPGETFEKLFFLLRGDHINGSSIYEHLKNSLLRWSIGFGLAVLMGIPFGILIGHFPGFFDLFIPGITILQIIPGLAWIPIALLLFGLGERATVFMIFITSLSPIVLNSAGGVREIPTVFLRASSMMGLKRFIFFFRVLLPASSLSIVNGLRIALASGWRVLIAAEMIVGSSLGLGYVIIQSRWNLDFEAAFAMIVIMASIGLFVEKILFEIIERRIRYKLGYESS